MEPNIQSQHVNKQLAHIIIYIYIYYNLVIKTYIILDYELW